MEDRHMFSQLYVSFIHFVQGMLQKSESYSIQDIKMLMSVKDQAMGCPIYKHPRQHKLR
jgi:hypothetical protein